VRGNRDSGEGIGLPLLCLRSDQRARCIALQQARDGHGELRACNAGIEFERALHMLDHAGIIACKQGNIPGSAERPRIEGIEFEHLRDHPHGKRAVGAIGMKTRRCAQHIGIAGSKALGGLIVRQCCPRFELAIGERKAKREMSPRDALFERKRSFGCGNGIRKQLTRFLAIAGGIIGDRCKHR